MTNERCRLISESQWREYLELVTKCNRLEQQLESETLAKQEGVELVAELEQKVHILNEANMALENAIGSHADYFRQRISMLEDRLKEAETVIQLYFKNTQNATHQSLGMNDGYYKKAFIHTVAKEYLEKYGVKND